MTVIDIPQARARRHGSDTHSTRGIVLFAGEIGRGDHVWCNWGSGWWGPAISAIWTDQDDHVRYATVNGGMGGPLPAGAPLLVWRPVYDVAA